MAFNDPEAGSRFLWKLHKKPLRERAIQVLGSRGPAILQAMKAAYTRSGIMSCNDFEAEARKILRNAARLEGQTNRVKYVRTCIRNEVCKHKLTCWLEEHPEMFPFLSDEEIRKIPKPERDAYNTARARAVIELE